MATEIERKYLLTSDAWKALAHKKSKLHQGYMCNSDKASVRVRIEDQEANINIKSMTLGMSRAEYEYSVPVQEAAEMLDTLCKKPQVEKHRYLVNHAGKIWEIDEFMGDNAGLIVAEIELNSTDEAFDIPDWVGLEVTDKERYYNMRLGEFPYSEWSDTEKCGE